MVVQTLTEEFYDLLNGHNIVFRVYSQLYPLISLRRRYKRSIVSSSGPSGRGIAQSSKEMHFWTILLRIDLVMVYVVNQRDTSTYAGYTVP